MAVVLEPYSPDWVERYREEAERIASVFGPNLIEIHHIGSTAIPDLIAKPIIDILGEVRSLEACDACDPEMRFLGYEPMGAYGITGRRYYRKFDNDRKRTHHLHVFCAGSHHLNRHLAFRDYLRTHPHEAERYADLKRQLVKIDDGDWDAYVSGKDRFVKEMEQTALDWYANAAC